MSGVRSILGYMGATWKHRLLGIDRETATGECQHCGPVPLKYRKDRDLWMCRPAYREGDRGRAQRTRYRGNGTVTQDAFTYALLAQDGHCAVCEDPIDRTAHADHDHATGAFRGVLCRPCNLGLGFFGDDPQRLRSAIAYLG